MRGIAPEARTASDTANRFVSTPRDEQPLLTLLASEQRLMVGGDSTSQEFSILEGNGERGHTTPRHLHRLAAETFVVLDGHLLFDADGQVTRASAGHVIVLPRMMAHSFIVTSPEARYLTVHTPAGFDAFVRDVSDASRDGSVPDRDTLRAIAAVHGIDILGPGIGLDGTIPLPGDES